jgi:hypothetical protein
MRFALKSLLPLDRKDKLSARVEQVEGFFHVLGDSLTAVPTLCRALRDRKKRRYETILPPGETSYAKYN